MQIISDKTAWLPRSRGHVWRTFNYVAGVLLLVSLGLVVFLRYNDAQAIVFGNQRQIKQIATGYGHTCAIASDNQAYCWGDGYYGQLGNGGSSDQITPAAISQGAMPAGATIRQISTGQTHTCAIASDNKAYCWGYQSSGRLGDGVDSVSAARSPVAISQGAMPAGATIRQISVGPSHTCAIASDNKAYCWGSGTYGRLGNGSTTTQTTPVAVSQGVMPAGVTIRQISAGAAHTCAIASDNQAYCWGYGYYRQLGNGSGSNQTTPVAVLQGVMPAGATIRQISTGQAHTCAIASDNKAYCWGYQRSGRLGDGTDSVSVASSPVAVSQGAMPAGATIRQVTITLDHTCVTASDNKAYCWGIGDDGSLGNGDTIIQTTPVAVLQGVMPVGATVYQISAGSSSTCAIASDNQAYCWGSGADSRLGNGSTDSQSSPVAVSPFATKISRFRNRFFESMIRRLVRRQDLLSRQRTPRQH